ncbi:MAG: phospholipid carrier-dependent glycosyltransferase [Anaerolineae bacterium]|nr:phospholipid carrier-dependent glycosyltransferase [Anaerolineae bacterium]
MIVILILYQMTRIIVFVNVYGGVEHDSGWFLGIARSLAEQGVYATMVSTMVDPTPGGGENIYGQYKVQNAKGQIYFFPESIGAAGVIPNAIIIKVFGPGFWAYRAGPLLFLLLGLILASALLYRLGGFLSVLMCQLFLFFYPQLLIFLGYEAMGEIFSLTYALLAFVLFLVAAQAKTYRWLWFMACGLAAGLAVTTKTIALLSLAGLFLAWLILYWQKRSSFKEGLILVGSCISVRLLWELMQLVSLTLMFDFQTYQRFLAQHLDFFLNEGGSGMGQPGPHSFTFLWQKILIVKEISFNNNFFAFAVFLVILFSGPGLMWRLFRDEARRNIVILLWGGWFIHSVWFIALAKGAWVRHNWHALILAIFLLSFVLVYAWQNVNHQPRWINQSLAVLLTGLLAIGFYGQANAAGLFISNQLVDRWYQEHLDSTYSRVPWIIIPRAEQDAALAVLQKLPTSGRLFYPAGHKSAELAVLSGRILYPLERRPLMPAASGDVIIVGPSLISPWAKLMEKPMSQAERQGLIDTVLQRVKQECPHLVFENSYYLICALD